MRWVLRRGGWSTGNGPACLRPRLPPQPCLPPQPRAPLRDAQARLQAAQRAPEAVVGGHQAAPLLGEFQRRLRAPPARTGGSQGGAGQSDVGRCGRPAGASARVWPAARDPSQKQPRLCCPPALTQPLPPRTCFSASARRCTAWPTATHLRRSAPARLHRGGVGGDGRWAGSTRLPMPHAHSVHKAQHAQNARQSQCNPPLLAARFSSINW